MQTSLLELPKESKQLQLRDYQLQVKRDLYSQKKSNLVSNLNQEEIEMLWQEKVTVVLPKGRKKSLGLFLNSYYCLFEDKNNE